MRNLTPNFVFMYGLLNDISSLREQDYKMILKPAKYLTFVLDTVGYAIENTSG